MTLRPGHVTLRLDRVTLRSGHVTSEWGQHPRGGGSGGCEGAGCDWGWCEGVMTKTDIVAHHSRITAH